MSIGWGERLISNEKKGKHFPLRLIVVSASIVVSFLIILAIYFESQSNSPDHVGFTLSRSSSLNYTITIVSVSSPLSLSNTSIKTVNATGLHIMNNTKLSDIKSSGYVKGVSLMDKNNDNNLTVGDYFILDTSFYRTGSEFILSHRGNILMIVEIT